MYKLCRIDINRSEKLHERIKQFVSKITSVRSIKRIYLFGSIARDDFNEDSDIDIAIIGDFKERLKGSIYHETFHLTSIGLPSRKFKTAENEGVLD